MAFAVYHSYIRRRSTIHRDGCRYYRSRQVPDDKSTGRWEGPFDTFEEAEASLPAFQRGTSLCPQCMRSHTTSGKETPLTVRGVDEETWVWLRARAVLEGRTVGELLNELIDEHLRGTGAC